VRLIPVAGRSHTLCCCCRDRWHPWGAVSSSARTPVTSASRQLAQHLESIVNLELLRLVSDRLAKHVCSSVIEGCMHCLSAAEGIFSAPHSQQTPEDPVAVSRAIAIISQNQLGQLAWFVFACISPAMCLQQRDAGVFVPAHMQEFKDLFTRLDTENKIGNPGGCQDPLAASPALSPWRRTLRRSVSARSN
jgi:hypothetical protein